ncbi:MAG: ABC transporter permease subunit [Candidatus Limnocylindrales bacterium]|jgi:arabinogalactan oligomer/maltooligosaccharide transport system permease protein
MSGSVQAIARPVARPAAAIKRRRVFRCLRNQAVMQALCILVTITVLFPIVYVFGVALDPRNLARPDGLNLIPPNPSLAAFGRAIAEPSPNPISFWELALNSLQLALSTSLVSVAFGVSAAYAFSRLKFRLRSALMIAVLAVLMLPSVATIAPLFVLLNSVKVGDFILRDSIPGVALALISGALPFAIWNLKGYLDTIPKDLEEAATIDGCTRNQSFRYVILPLAMPALAVTAFLGFVAGWTDFYFSWMFLDHTKDFTLTMALFGMVGTYANTTPWSTLSAFAILVSLPVSVVYLIFQRWIIGGLAIGGVKG